MHFNQIGFIYLLATMEEHLLLLFQVFVSIKFLTLIGTEITRPSGQVQKNKDNPKEGSIYSPCRLLDYELEMAFFVGKFFIPLPWMSMVGGKSNELGRPLTMEEAEDRIFGVVLMNDWSARDIQVDHEGRNTHDD